MCLSRISWRIRVGMTSIPCSPCRMRATLASSKTCGAPGRPSAAPVMTTGSADGAGVRRRTRGLVEVTGEHPTGSRRRVSGRSATRRTLDAVPTLTAPMPDAYSPHSAWLKAVVSPSLGWFVASATTSSPRTSAANPCSALLRPDLDEHASARVVQRPQIPARTGPATPPGRPAGRASRGPRQGPSGRARRSRSPRSGSRAAAARGAPACAAAVRWRERRSRCGRRGSRGASRSGSRAAGTARRPPARPLSRPPMTACDVELTLAMTT